MAADNGINFSATMSTEEMNASLDRLVSKTAKAALDIGKQFEVIDAAFSKSVARLNEESARAGFDPLSKSAQRLREDVKNSGLALTDFVSKLNGLDKGSFAFKTLQERASQARQELEKVDKSLPKESFSQKIEGLTSLATAMRGFIASIIVQQVYEFVKSLSVAGQEIESLRVKLAAFTGSTEASESQIRFLKDTAKELGLEFESVAKVYPRLVASGQQLGLSTERVQQLFYQLAQASAAFNLPAEKTTAVMAAIEQIMSKGKLAAEELRGQLGDSLPGALTILSNKIGVTTQELDAMLRKGQLASDKYLPLLADAFSEAFGEAAQKGASTTAAEVNRFTNEVLYAKQALGEQLNPSIKEILSSLTSLISLLSSAKGEVNSFVTGFGAFGSLLKSIADLVNGDFTSAFAKLGVVVIDSFELMIKGITPLMQFIPGFNESVFKGAEELKSKLESIADEHRSKEKSDESEHEKFLLNLKEDMGKRQIALQEDINKKKAELSDNELKSYERLKSAIDEAYSVSSKYKESVEEINAAELAGLETKESAAKLIQKLKEETLAQIIALKEKKEISKEEYESLLKLIDATDKSTESNVKHRESTKADADETKRSKEETEGLIEARKKLEGLNQQSSDSSARIKELEGKPALSTEELNEYNKLKSEQFELANKLSEAERELAIVQAGGSVAANQSNNANFSLNTSFNLLSGSVNAFTPVANNTANAVAKVGTSTRGAKEEVDKLKKSNDSLVASLQAQQEVLDKTNLAIDLAGVTAQALDANMGVLQYTIDAVVPSTQEAADGYIDLGMAAQDAGGALTDQQLQASLAENAAYLLAKAQREQAEAFDAARGSTEEQGKAIEGSTKLIKDANGNFRILNETVGDSVAAYDKSKRSLEIVSEEIAKASGFTNDLADGTKKAGDNVEESGVKFDEATGLMSNYSKEAENMKKTTADIHEAVKGLNLSLSDTVELLKHVVSGMQSVGEAAV